MPLMVAEGSAIQVTFTSLEIEECNEFEDGTKGHCLCDYVEVLDTDKHQILKACGANLPEQLTSTGHTMTIIFHSDHSPRPWEEKLKIEIMQITATVCISGTD